MILIQASNVSKSFGAEPILTDIQLTVQQGERIGLIGANGAGKSTLLQIMIGQLQPDQGSVHVKKGASVGYLAQHSGLTSERTIWEEMLTVFSDLRSQEKELRRLEKQMAETENPDAPAYEQLLEHYASFAHTFEEQGGYRYEADIRGVLHGLNFQAFDYENTPVEALSGGQKTRLALAKLLLTRPDVLMLDEPTNYLDIDTMTWLEQYLEQYEGAILVVSHDRYFLDRLTNVIYEIEGTKARRFTGNYSAYVKQKETLREKEWKAYEKQQEEIARAEDFIQRNIARASTSSRAKSRRKMLEKTERLDKPADLSKTSRHLLRYRAGERERCLKSGGSVDRIRRQAAFIPPLL